MSTPRSQRLWFLSTTKSVPSRRAPSIIHQYSQKCIRLPPHHKAFCSMLVLIVIVLFVSSAKRIHHIWTIEADLIESEFNDIDPSGIEIRNSKKPRNHNSNPIQSSNKNNQESATMVSYFTQWFQSGTATAKTANNYNTNDINHNLPQMNPNVMKILNDQLYNFPFTFNWDYLIKSLVSPIKVTATEDILYNVAENIHLNNSAKSILARTRKKLEAEGKMNDEIEIEKMKQYKLNIDELRSSILWENRQYYGYCRSYFFTYLATVSNVQENGFLRVVDVINQTKSTKKNIKSTKLDSTMNDFFNRVELWKKNPSVIRLSKIGIYKASKYLSSLFSSVSSVNSISSSTNSDTESINRVKRYIYAAFEYYNTSNINGWNDEQRVNYLKNVKSQYRIDSATLIIKTDYIDDESTTIGKSEEEIDEIINKKYIIEIIVCDNEPKNIWNSEGVHDKFEWDEHGNNPSINNNRFLCVFSNGVTIVSHKIRHSRDFSHFIVECDITQYPEMIEMITKHDNKRGGYGYNTFDINFEHLIESPIITNIGLSLFNLLPKQSSLQLLNEFLISANTQIPVCSTIEINRQPQWYENSAQFHKIENDLIIDPNTRQLNKRKNIKLKKGNTKTKKHNKNNNINKNTMKKNIDLSNMPRFHKTQLNMTSLLNSKTVDGGRKYFLTIMNCLHPASRSGQVDLLVKQWLDYHIFQGFDHFYLYDHLMNRDSNDISYFYDNLIEYIVNGYVTLVQWPITVKKDEKRNYEVSAYLDTMRRFQNDATYVMLADIDEWVITMPKRLWFPRTKLQPNSGGSSSHSGTNQGNTKGATGFLGNKNMRKHTALTKKDILSFPIFSEVIKHARRFPDLRPKSSKYYGKGMFNYFEIMTYPSMANIYGEWSKYRSLTEMNKKAGIKDFFDDNNVANGNQDGSNMNDNIYSQKFGQRSRIPNSGDSSMNINIMQQQEEGMDIPQQWEDIVGVNTNAHTNYFKIKSQNKRLGCDKKSLLNRFDTYFERASCMHYKIQNFKIIDYFLEKYSINITSKFLTKQDRYSNYQRSKYLCQSNTVSCLEYDILDELREIMSPLRLSKERKKMEKQIYLNNNASIISIQALNHPRLSERQRILQKLLILFDYFNEKAWWLSYQLTPKIIIDPTIAYVGYQHKMFEFETQYNESKVYEYVPFYASSYDAFMIHTTDHWRVLGFYHRAGKLINMTSIEDLKLIYEITASKCDFQDIILSWNNRFLMSQHGQKYMGQLGVNPLFDQFGRFCYDLDPNYKQAWKDE